MKILLQKDSPERSAGKFLLSKDCNGKPGRANNLKQKQTFHCGNAHPRRSRTVGAQRKTFSK
jgi:hypothetical protein